MYFDSDYNIIKKEILIMTADLAVQLRGVGRQGRQVGVVQCATTKCPPLSQVDNVPWLVFVRLQDRGLRHSQGRGLGIAVGEIISCTQTRSCRQAGHDV